jgi:hypothetical protein
MAHLHTIDGMKLSWLAMMRDTACNSERGRGWDWRIHLSQSVALSSTADSKRRLGLRSRWRNVLISRSSHRVVVPFPSPHAGSHNPDRRSHSRCSCSRLSKFRGVAPSVLVWRGFGRLCSSVWRRRGSRGWLGMLSLLNGPAVGFSPSPIVLQSGVASIGQAGTCRTRRLEPSECGRSAGLSWLLSVLTPRVPSGAASQYTREPPHSRCQ